MLELLNVGGSSKMTSKRLSVVDDVLAAWRLRFSRRKNSTTSPRVSPYRAGTMPLSCKFFSAHDKYVFDRSTVWTKLAPPLAAATESAPV